MTLRVPSEYPTIQAGIDASAAGDTVLVAPGTYTDFEVRGTRTACVFLKAGVILRSEAGSLFTTIDMQGMGAQQPNVIFGVSLALPGTSVEGFTITGVVVGRSGVLVAESEKVVFRDCALVDMDGGDTGSAGGINAARTDVDLLDCSFENCRASLGGGIFQNEARLFVSGCVFVDCPHAVSVRAETAVGELVVENSSFVRNRTTGSGGAILSNEYRQGVRVTGCYFEENEAAVSGGAVTAVAGHGPLIIESCIFWNNRTTVAGSLGGAVSINGDGVVTRCTFFGNGAVDPKLPGAIAFRGPYTSELENNVIAGTIAGVAVGTRTGAAVNGGCNVFWDNVDGNAIGYVLAETDREVDPLFCDADAGDFTVAEESPCLPANSGGCGLIGALGAGCGIVSIEAATWARIKAFYRLEPPAWRNER